MSKTPTIQHEVRSIGPAEATALLAKIHPKQRSVVPKAVARYAEAMKAGQWVLSPHGIVIDAKGFVVDGQHRLLAVKKSGCTVPFSVSVLSQGMDATGIDRGTPRVAGHVIEMQGIVERGEGRWMSAACNALLMISRDSNDYRDHEVYLNRVIAKSGDALREARSLVPGCGKGAAVVAAYAYALPCDHAYFSNVMRSVRDNDGLEKGTGSWHLHRILTSAKVKNKEDSLDLGLRILRCLMAARCGETLKEIRARTGDSVPPGLAYFRKLRKAKGIGEDVY